MKTNNSQSFVLGALFMLLIGFTVSAHAYTAPTATPPGGDVPAPINVGPNAGAYQLKSDALGVTGFANFGTSAFADMVRVGNNANVEIGSTSFFSTIANRLHVIASNTNYSTAVSVDTLNTNQQSIVGFSSAGTQKWQLGKDTGDNFILWDNAHNRTTINATTAGDLSLQSTAGNVGIGTTTPAEKLQVSGGALIGSTWSGRPSQNVYDTSHPFKLWTDGSADVKGSLWAKDIFIGDDVGNTYTEINGQTIDLYTVNPFCLNTNNVNASVKPLTLEKYCTDNGSAVTTGTPLILNGVYQFIPPHTYVNSPAGGFVVGA